MELIVPAVDSSNGVVTSSLRGRRIADLPPDLVGRLSLGEIETRTWTEWMSVDTAILAEAVACDLPAGRLKNGLNAVAQNLDGYGILDRLARVGSAVAEAAPELNDPSYLAIARHRSDAVRQWAAYSVNDPRRVMPLSDRLALTLPFAADPHMSVRECAWMAFRPFLLRDLEEVLRLLAAVARAPDPRLRRFSIEVSRPRSVWGRHCEALKRQPEMARSLLEPLHREEARYVQLAVGNWINDASKTRPDWARALCAEWSQLGDRRADAMVRRGLRTLRGAAAPGRCGLAQADSALSSPGGPNEG